MVAQTKKVIRIKRQVAQPKPKQWPESLSVTLDLPPSANAAYEPVVRYNKQTHKAYAVFVPSKELCLFKQSAAILLYEQGAQKGSWAGVEAIGIKGTVYVPARRRDLDNCLKHGIDALIEYLCSKDTHKGNDNRVEDLNVKRRLDADKPRFEITVYPVRKALKGEL